MLLASAVPHFHVIQLPFVWLCLGCLPGRNRDALFPFKVLAPFMRSVGSLAAVSTPHLQCLQSVTVLIFTNLVLTLFRLGPRPDSRGSRPCGPLLLFSGCVLPRGAFRAFSLAGLLSKGLRLERFRKNLFNASGLYLAFDMMFVFASTSALL